MTRAEYAREQVLGDEVRESVWRGPDHAGLKNFDFDAKEAVGGFFKAKQ